MHPKVIGLILALLTLARCATEQSPCGGIRSNRLRSMLLAALLAVATSGCADFETRLEEGDRRHQEKVEQDLEEFRKEAARREREAEAKFERDREDLSDRSNDRP